jgi:hypothetical protein
VNRHQLSAEEQRAAAWTARLILATLIALAAMYAATPEPRPVLDYFTPEDGPSSIEVTIRDGWGEQR